MSTPLPPQAAGISESEPPAPMPPSGYTGPFAPPIDTPPANPPAKLDPHEKMRIRTAAFQAKRVYPGAVGELIAKELLDWENFGFRFGTTGGLVHRLVDEVMRPAPTDFDV